MTVFEVAGPDWLEDDDTTSCETCGHWSSFSAGFEYDESGYVQGWYEDEISCFGGDSYYSYLSRDWEKGAGDYLDTAENFRDFLSRTDFEEARDLLHELDRLGL